MSESEKRIAPFGLRLPPELRARVQESAIASNRSMNAEIIARLERTFAEDDMIPSDGDAVTALAEKLARLETAVARLVEKDTPSE